MPNYLHIGAAAAAAACWLEDGVCDVTRVVIKVVTRALDSNAPAPAHEVHSIRISWILLLLYWCMMACGVAAAGKLLVCCELLLMGCAAATAATTG